MRRHGASGRLSKSRRRTAPALFERDDRLDLDQQLRCCQGLHAEESVADIRTRAERRGRGDELTFGMRLQIVVRDTEEEAWANAWSLIEGATDEQRAHRATVRDESQADRRMWTIANETDGYRVAPHLWSGISTIRTGAGMAVVGNPRQVADTLQQFVDIGCTEFCLSGYPHAREAERFGRLVMPLFAGRLVASGAPA